MPLPRVPTATVLFRLALRAPVVVTATVWRRRRRIVKASPEEHEDKPRERAFRGEQTMGGVQVRDFFV